MNAVQVVASLEYGLAVPLESSSTVPLFSDIKSLAYAFCMTFGERLAAARKSKGMSQAELGAGLAEHGADAGKQVVSGWENNRHPPNARQLALICKRLDKSADHLLFGYEGLSPVAAEAARVIDALEPHDKERLLAIVRTFAPLKVLEATQ
jgi:transcriptional regulator with XRE-family HTH domain